MYGLSSQNRVFRHKYRIDIRHRYFLYAASSARSPFVTGDGNRTPVGRAAEGYIYSIRAILIHQSVSAILFVTWEEFIKKNATFL